MELTSLVAHPNSGNSPALDVYAVALFGSGGRVTVRYRVRGDISQIRLPTEHAGQRTDGLWRHTCFEAFVAPKDAERYIELNFSPSSAWAAYTFDQYRIGMKPLPVIKQPTVRLTVESDLLAVDVTAQMRSLAADWRVGFAAVIETTDGRVTHWAAVHPSPKPDFHDAKGWVASFQRHNPEDKP